MTVAAAERRVRGGRSILPLGLVFQLFHAAILITTESQIQNIHDKTWQESIVLICPFTTGR